MSAQSSNRIRLALIILTLLICAFGSFWWLQVLHRDRDDTVTELPKGEPDYSVEKFNLVRMAKNGHARYSISGAKLVHYPDTDTFEIQQPVLYSVGENRAPLTMRAEQAVIEHKANKVHMHRRVRIDRAATENSARFHLTSEYLLVLPDEDIMKTDKAVDITFGDSHLAGIGMIANNATREFKLLHQVRGTLSQPEK
ncbi:MAG TPA: LPS export ABC transporter periplasmic protein LptC [Paucimonas sp.]|nr:LPS export ABC transporter periplasmic protein LptC [Paucimonas sp.]